MHALALTAAVALAVQCHAGAVGEAACSASSSESSPVAAAGSQQAASCGRLARLAGHLSVTPAPEPATAKTADAAAATKPARPHILLIVADDLGWNDVGSFNGPGLATPYAPAMDELMAQGVKLKQHYSEAICSPTRGALMSGRYPHRWGGQSAVAIQNTQDYFPLDEITLATRLKEAGYATHLTGAFLSSPFTHFVSFFD
jgi:hypothetical protein